MRKRRSFTRPEGKKEARLVVIAAEGRCTEQIYFEALAYRMNSSRVHIEFLERKDNNSSPENVQRQIAAFKAEYEISDDDELWVVVDKDKWEDKMFSIVAQNCQQEEHTHFCLSNPCFEFWLLLHLRKVSDFTKEELDAIYKNKRRKKSSLPYLKQLLREIMGAYKESSYDAFSLLEHVDLAIESAIYLDVNPQDRWPQRLGTRVYRLVQSILEIEN
jgi:hypothetical protein